MYDDILKVKVFKEERALSQLEEAKEAVVAAEQALEDGRQAVEDFKVFRKTEKVRLFKKVQNEQVTMQAVDKMNRAIAKLKEEELRLIEKVEELRKAVVEAKNKVVEAEEAYKSAQVDVQKFEEVKKIVDEEQRAEQVAKEELEQEDLMRPMNTNF